MLPITSQETEELARVSTYLNFQGNAGEALELYGKAFGSELTVPVTRYQDMPADSNGPAVADNEKEMIMHAELPILAGHVIMVTDMLESLDQKTRIGNNTTINLEPDSLDEAQRIYDVLVDGATETVPLSPMPWNAIWGVLLDRFGIRWMFNVPQ
jgi:PhnB protein